MNKLVYEQALVIPIVGGESGIVNANVIDNLKSFSTTDALSANQGRVLDGKIYDLANRVAPVTDESGNVIETKEQYLMRVPMSLRYVGMTVVLNDGFRYEFKGGIQDKNLVRVEVPTGEGGGSSVDVVDSLTSSSTDKALSANQGKILNESKVSNETFQGHTRDYFNPHKTTAEQVGAAAKVHRHDVVDIDNLTPESIGAADRVHTHVISDITGLQGALDSKLNKTIWDSIFELVDGGIRVKGNLLANGDVVAYTRTGIEGGGGAGGGLISKVYSESELAKEILVESLTETFSAKAIKSIYDRAVTNTQNITNHENNRKNPHGVTYQQVGAAAASHSHTISNVEGLQSALDNKANSSDLSSHIGNNKNPHGVTTDQIGAATSSDLNAHKGNANNPHSVTATQVGAPTLSEYNSHKENTSNPHNVTKTQVGLGNVDNTSDINKPISNATQAALDKKLDKSIWDGIFELVDGGIKVKGNLLANGDVVAFAKSGIEGGGGSGGGLITRVYGLSNLGTDVGVENLTETFSAKAIQDIYNRTVSVSTDLLNHKGDRNNPHGVTTTQIGALPINGKAADTSRFDGLSMDQFPAQVNYQSTTDMDTERNGLIGGKLFNATNAPHNYYSFLSVGYDKYKMQFNAYNNILEFRAGDESGLSNKSWVRVYHTGNFDPSSKLGKTEKAVDSDKLDGLDSVRFLRSIYGSDLNANNASDMSIFKTSIGYTNSNLPDQPNNRTSLLTIHGYDTNYKNQIFFGNGTIWNRTDDGSWKKFWDSGNCNLPTTNWIMQDADISRSIKQTCDSQRWLWYIKRSDNTHFRGLQSNGKNLSIWTDNSERVSISENGNVGIGVLSPTEKFVVWGNIYVNGHITVGNSKDFRINDKNGSAKRVITLDSNNDTYIGSVDAGLGDLYIRHNGNNTIRFTGSNPSSSICLNSGSVGIGTVSPSSKLHIVGTTSSGWTNNCLTQIGGAEGDTYSFSSYTKYNWYNTNWEVGIRRGGSSDYFNFSIAKNGTSFISINDSDIYLRNRIGIGCDPIITLAIGDSDTGFDLVSDGFLNGKANGVDVYGFTSAEFAVYRRSTVNDTLRIIPVNKSNAEGLRINRAPNGYSVIGLGCEGWDGTVAKQWMIANDPNGNLLFNRKTKAVDSGTDILFFDYSSGVATFSNAVKSNYDVVAGATGNGTVFYRPATGGYSWNNGNGALTVDIRNNENQTPLLLARRENSSERLFSLELLNSGGHLHFVQRGNNMIRLVNGSNIYLDKATHCADNITSAGEIAAYSSSDKRFKKDVKKLEKCTDFVDKLNPVSYYWNSRAKELMPHKSDSVDFGLIAQELEEVCPELVHTIFDEYKSIDYVKLIPFLIGAIQELNKKVKDLCQCQTES